MWEEGEEEGAATLEPPPSWGDVEGPCSDRSRHDRIWHWVGSQQPL